MKRKTAIILLIVSILSVAATATFYLYYSRSEQPRDYSSLSGEGCTSDNVPEAVTFSRESQSTNSKIDTVLRKYGGEITQNYGFTSFAKVKAGSEDLVVRELSKIEGVTASRSRYKCPL